LFPADLKEIMMGKHTLLFMLIALILSACGPQTAPSQASATDLAGTSTVPEIQMPTLTPLLTMTDTPLPLRVRTTDKMEMVYVPAGPFIMGEHYDVAFNLCSGEYYNCEVVSAILKGEGPRHTVTLDSFWIDRTEVTNAMYALCINAGACPVQNDFWSTPMPLEWYSIAQVADKPITNVTWFDATAYCTWAGGRLPTEAEWEKAARGTDGRIYPWGEFAPTSERIGMTLGEPTEPVGSHPLGASPYGVLDMAGNTRQWVADFFSETYYSDSPALNPQGPPDSPDHVIRGSVWNSPHYELATYFRDGLEPTATTSQLSFRCAASAP
jgi:formylglycine-generating enzyme required for sulfatase activity